MRKVRTALLAALAAFLSASGVSANEPTHASVCLRINRAGELVSLIEYKSQSFIRSEQTMAAIRRAAPFPPLPEGAPEVVDFHYDVTCGCTGWLMLDKMRLCNTVHEDRHE